MSSGGSTDHPNQYAPPPEVGISNIHMVSPVAAGLAVDIDTDHSSNNTIDLDMALCGSLDQGLTMAFSYLPVLTTSIDTFLHSVGTPKTLLCLSSLHHILHLSHLYITHFPIIMVPTAGALGVFLLASLGWWNQGTYLSVFLQVAPTI